MVARRAVRGSEPFASAPPARPLRCALCERPLVDGPSVDEHHLLPRSQGGREKTPIHRVCHRKIHATLSEKELARGYTSWAALRTHPEIADFIRWLANKPPTFDDRSVRPNRRR